MEVDPKAELAYRNISRVMEIHGLMKEILEVRLKTADRFFFAAAPALYFKLLRERGDFAQNLSSGGPHRLVYQVFPELGRWGAPTSFRSFERPSLQVTLAFAGGMFCGDADLDLGNPVMDVVGFLTHLAELIVPGKTSHERLEKGISERYVEWKRSRQEENV